MDTYRKCDDDDTAGTFSRSADANSFDEINSFTPIRRWGIFTRLRPLPATWTALWSEFLDAHHWPNRLRMLSVFFNFGLSASCLATYAFVKPTQSCHCWTPRAPRTRLVFSCVRSHSPINANAIGRSVPGQIFDVDVRDAAGYGYKRISAIFLTDSNKFCILPFFVYTARYI